MFDDNIQQVFYLLVADYATYVLAPLFLGSSLGLAILMTIADYWRPVQRVEINDPNKKEEMLID